MNQIKSIFKNTTWIMSSEFLSSICAFIWNIIIARYLGVSDFGILAFAISFTSLFSIMMDLGINTYITRDIVRNPELTSKYLGNILPLKLILSAISFFIILIILNILGYGYLKIEVTMIFVIEAIFISMNGILNGVLQAHNKMEHQAIGLYINSILLLVCILGTIHFNLGLIGIASSYLIAYITVTIYLYLRNRKIVKPRFEINIELSKKILKASIPFGFTGFFYTIYYSIDTTMISMMIGNSASGLYNASYKFLAILTTFYAIYQVVIFPVMSKLYTDNENLLKISFEKSIKYLLILVVPCVIGIFLYSSDIITLIYKPNYLEAGNILKVLIWTSIFLFINGAAGLTLNASNKERSVTKIYGTAAIFNVCLNLILIPFYSYYGAAIATILSEILISLLMIHIISKSKLTPKKSIFKDIIKIIFSATIMGIILNLLNLNMFIAIPTGLIIYIIVLLLTKPLDDTDKYILRSIKMKK